MLNALEPWHLLIIVGVLVVLFGAKRLPGSARSLGNSLRIFRSEMAKGSSDRDAALAPASTTAVLPDTGIRTEVAAPSIAAQPTTSAAAG